MRRQAFAVSGTVAAVWLAGCTSGGDVEGTDTENATSTETTASPVMSTDDPDYLAMGTMTDTPVMTSDGTTACVTQPELTKGPYYIDEDLRRSDIRADSDTGEQEDGVGLDLGFRVFELIEDSCTSLDNAIVDMWHANASGVYFDVEMQNTIGQDFLRGIQLTDGAGAVLPTTTYPGWYTGRAVHIHFKVRLSDDAVEVYEFASQLFFDGDLTDRVYAQAPYADRGNRDTLNSEGNIFQQDNAAQLVLDLTETSEGYSGTLNVALYTSGEMAADDSFSTGGGGPDEPPDRSESSNDSNPPATTNDTTTE